MWHKYKRENYTTLNNKGKMQELVEPRMYKGKQENTILERKINTGSYGTTRQYMHIREQKFLWLQYNVIQNEQEKQATGMKN